jgi:hypothetical protein
LGHARHAKRSSQLLDEPAAGEIDRPASRWSGWSLPASSRLRDELPNLFRATSWLGRRGQTCSFSEFLERHCDDLRLPKSERKALVQIHCHHHAVMKDDAGAASCSGSASTSKMLVGLLRHGGVLRVRGATRYDVSMARPSGSCCRGCARRRPTR